MQNPLSDNKDIMQSAFFTTLRPKKFVYIFALTALSLTQTYNTLRIKELAKLNANLKASTTLYYTNKIESLNQTRDDLKSLIEFIDYEKDNLKTTEEALQSLRSEHNRLQKIIESDRKVIDAIFTAQEERNKITQNNERIFGFWIGVSSSLIATILWTGISWIISKRRNKQSV